MPTSDDQQCQQPGDADCTGKPDGRRITGAAQSDVDNKAPHKFIAEACEAQDCALGGGEATGDDVFAGGAPQRAAAGDAGAAGTADTHVASAAAGGADAAPLLEGAARSLDEQIAQRMPQANSSIDALHAAQLQQALRGADGNASDDDCSVVYELLSSDSDSDSGVGHNSLTAVARAPQSSAAQQQQPAGAARSGADCSPSVYTLLCESGGLPMPQGGDATPAAAVQRPARASATCRAWLPQRAAAQRHAVAVASAQGQRCARPEPRQP